MKKIWIFLGIIVLLFLVGYLYKIGVIKTDWQFLSMILAALAGPFTYLQQHLKGSGSKKVQDIVVHQNYLQQQDEVLRQRYEQLLQEKELKIQQLQAELARLQDQLEQLQLQEKDLQSQVQNMSVDQKQQQFIDFYGS